MKPELVWSTCPVCRSSVRLRRGMLEKHWNFVGGKMPLCEGIGRKPKVNEFKVRPVIHEKEQS